MSFLFGRARSRATADLARQAREHIGRLDGPNASVKVIGIFYTVQCSVTMLQTLARADFLQADDLARVLGQMKVVLQGTQGKFARPCINRQCNF